MSQLYICENASHINGKLIGRVSAPSDPSCFTDFLKLKRAEGLQKALQFFPKEWEWLDWKGALSPILDLVPIMTAGLVLSDSAFEKVGHLFDAGTPYVKIDIKWAPFFWLDIHQVDTETELFLPEYFPSGAPIVSWLCDKKTSVVYVSNKLFMETWNMAGLTGAVFTRI